jgi:two-component system sensor histidine kinase BaeS
MLVAVSATAATAWLTLQQASQQINESATVDQAQLDQVVAQLEEYGRRHGTWEGVPGLVQELRARTGQRIHLVAETGEVIVDTDTQENRTSRPLGTMTGFVDPRPVLDLSAPPADPAQRPGAVVKAVASYLAGVLLAARLTRRDIPVAVSPGAIGVPTFRLTCAAPTWPVTRASRWRSTTVRPPRTRPTRICRATSPGWTAVPPRRRENPRIPAWRGPSPTRSAT